MSEEQATPAVNNELTNRVNSAFIAQDYTLLNGGTDNIVMITGEKGENKADILMTYEGLEQVVEGLRAEINPKTEPHEL